MKVYIVVDNKYILLEDNLKKDNINNSIIKEDIINNAMNRLEQEKLEMEIIRQRENPVKVKKFGLHPSMKKAA